MSHSGILSGIRVIDLTWVLAGPFATRILGDFGAEVIKVQSLKTAKGAESNLDGYFATWNRNKRSVTLDMSRSESRDLVLRLAGISDVVIENFAPRVMDNWGLTYEEFSRANPQIIMARMSAMGQTGPWREHVAFGPSLQALAGLTYLSSYDDTHPVGLGYAYGDHVIGLYGALGVLSALENRSRTGRGCRIDVSGYEAVCTLVGPALMRESLGEATVRPRGNRSGDPDVCPQGCYPCLGEERWCVISASTDDEWRALCAALGRPDLPDDDRFRTASARRANEPELDALIAGWAAERTAEDAVALLQEAGVPAGVVQSAEDLADDLHLAARGFFVSLEHPVLGRTRADRTPIRFVGDDQPPDWKAAPLLGEDNRYVFKELLGLTEEEFAGYRRDGVIS